MSVSSLGYIAITAQDLPAWEKFGTEILGMMLSDRSDDSCLYFRMDDHPSRLIVEQGEEDKLAGVGWEFDDQASFQAMCEKLGSAGVEVCAGVEDLAQRRNVTEIGLGTDPAGNPFEIYYQRTGLQDDFVSAADVSRFVTDDMGMGHVVLPAPNTDETHDFYKSVFGFGDSDNLTLPPAVEGAPEMNIRFMHACNPRHHSLALFNYPVPTGIVHLILEVGSIDEVGACLDRVQKAGYPLMSTLGRHCNDNMVSFYVVGPGGIAVEYGYDGVRIDWQNYQPTVSTVGDFWGHEYVPPPAP